MTQSTTKPASQRKTPETASDFEREQLRFFLSGSDLATTLATLNPSLAWLPVLSQMKLIRGETQLAAWIERNFEDVDAVRDVVANIRFFGPDTANILEYRLNERIDSLPTLLTKCWRLIVRHMRTTKHGLLQSEWFEIAPRIKRGETSAELLARIADALRPKLTINKRIAFRDIGIETPERPSDLMSLDYEVEDGLSPDEVLSAWPESLSAEIDEKILFSLTAALITALDDATDVGVEGNQGYSISDSDIPSVAKHSQNEYRSGFYPIVRVIADLWERLAKKSPVQALRFFANWRDSPFKLVRRLALFAGAHAIVPSDFAADMLLKLPQGELFLTNASVEVFRLIRARWKDFTRPKQEAILQRVCIGPPRDWFKQDSEIDRVVDRSRFDFLGEMERDKLHLSAEADAVLKGIRVRWPNWELRPGEQAGFHIWHSGVSHIEGDPTKLQDVADTDLVDEAKKAAAAADFLDGDSWQALCLSDPDRALRGLSAAATRGDWSKGLWRDLLWARKEYAHPGTRAEVAQLLLEWPAENFAEIAPAASSWLDEHAKLLEDVLLWPLWDRIADAALIETAEAGHE